MSSYANPMDAGAITWYVKMNGIVLYEYVNRSASYLPVETFITVIRVINVCVNDPTKL